jgi:hypothetical protein
MKKFIRYFESKYFDISIVGILDCTLTNEKYEKKKK